MHGNEQEIYIILPEEIGERLTEQELLTLIGHEIGHIYDPLDSVGLDFVFEVIEMLVKIVLLAYFIRRFHLKEQLLKVIPLYFALTVVISCFMNPLYSMSSQYFEYEADRYTVELIGDEEALISLIQKMAIQESALQLPPGVSQLFLGHPTIYGRIEP